MVWVLRPDEIKGQTEETYVAGRILSAGDDQTTPVLFRPRDWTKKSSSLDTIINRASSAYKSNFA